MNSWAHVSVLFNPVDAEMRLLVNGSLSTTSYLGSGVPGRGASDLLSFAPNLGEFRIWSGILSEADLFSHFVNGPKMNLCECSTDLSSLTFLLSM